MFYLSENFYRDDLDTREVMVSVKCITYNHADYIKKALEGFVNQKTDFRYEVIIHDDCSTDGTDLIIKEYAIKYPSIIKPIFETENQYHKKDGSIGRILRRHTRGKYIAMCEGDDYWIDPFKLQKQVDFLESHPDYSMIATNCLYDRNGNMQPGSWNVQYDYDPEFKEVVFNGGLFLATTSLLTRAKYYPNRPPEVTSQYVGDYPLQIYFAYIGKVRIINDITCVYRLMSQGSWSSMQVKGLNRDKILTRIKNEHRLLDAMDKVTEYKYHDIFLEQKDYFKLIILEGFNKPFECLPIYLKRFNAFKKRIGVKALLYRFLQYEVPGFYSVYHSLKTVLSSKKAIN